MGNCNCALPMVDAVCTENQNAWENVTAPHSSEQMHSEGMAKYCRGKGTKEGRG